MELKPGYYQDPLTNYLSSREKCQLSQTELPVLVYDDYDLDRWNNIVNKNKIKETPVVNLHTVSDDPVPARWLGSLVGTARLLEELKNHGVSLPDNWQLFSPVYINGLANQNENPETAVAQAVQLAELSRSYISQFHPDLPWPELCLDTPENAAYLLDLGHNLAPHLSDRVSRELSAMAKNHENGNNNGDRRARTAAYLLAHYQFYESTPSLPKMLPTNKPALYVVPQSEARFIGLMGQAGETLPTVQHLAYGRPEYPGTTLMLRDVIRPHYYPYRNEMLLSALKNPSAWETHPDSGELTSIMSMVFNDIGGRSGQSILADIIERHGL